MNILITTQKVDSADPILGFFHGWLLRFAAHYDKVTVICLYEGVHDLPPNVTVCSLGKERCASRIQYVINFFRYIYMYRKTYDRVFVHMNEEYILLGGVIWRLMGKRIFMWRNHKSGSWKTRFAVMLADKVFYTSPDSFTAQFKNTQSMPVGIDTDFFMPDTGLVRSIDVLYVGRISPIKRIDVLIDALSHIKAKGLSVPRTIIVGPVDNDLDMKYKSRLIKLTTDLGLDDFIEWRAQAVGKDLVKLYHQSKICVNVTESGSFDKTVVESIAAGCVPLVANQSVVSQWPEHIRSTCSFAGSEDLSRKLQVYAVSTDEERSHVVQSLKPFVAINSLDTLMESFTQYL